MSFVSDCRSDKKQQVSTITKTVKAKYQVIMVLRDIFGFAEHPEKKLHMI